MFKTKQKLAYGITGQDNDYLWELWVGGRIKGTSRLLVMLFLDLGVGYPDGRSLGECQVELTT